MSTSVLREITPLGEHDFMYVADRHKKEFDYPIHQHEIFELNFVMGGAGCRRVVGDSDEIIGDLDLVLITSPDLEHVWEQNGAQTEDIHEVTVQFNMERGLAFPSEAIMMVSHRLLNLSKIKEGFLAVQEFLSILYELSKFEGARELASSAFAKVEVDSDSKRILKVKNYIDDHYRDEIMLEQLAALVSMSPSAFSRYFKLHTGKSLSEYIIDVRLGHAARKLVDTTDSVSEICWTTGFNTLSNFNRLFRKRKGCTPKEFREKYQKTKLII